MRKTTNTPAALARWVKAAAYPFLTATALLGALPALAQVPYEPAITAEESASGGPFSPAVENTGAEAGIIAGAPLRVMCWDGVKPALAWNYRHNISLTGRADLLGSSLGAVTDPDVVVDPSDRGSGSSSILVTYLVNGRVYYEVRRYDPGTNTLSNVTSSPIQVNSGAATCSNPNVDIAFDGEAVVTYEQGGNIYARVYNIAATPVTTYPISRITSQSGYTFSEPDVAVYRVPTPNPTTASTKLVSFVFLSDGPSGRTVNVRQANITTVRAGSQLTGGSTFAVFTGSGFTEAPRIAAPVDYGVNTYFNQLDYQVVVNDMASTGNEIWGINRYQGGSPTTALLNGTDGLNVYSICEKPVVAYVGDNIVTSWTLNDAGSFPPTLSGDKDVLARRLGWNGQPSSTSSFSQPVYSIVNQDMAGDQSLPSIGGRYTTNVSVSVTMHANEAFYAFYHGPKEDVFYKSAYYGAYQLRGGAAAQAAPVQKAAAPTARLALYPNPFHGTATIQLPLAAGEQVQSLEVYNLTGQRAAVLDGSSLSAGTTGELRWNAEAAGLKPGLYLLRLRTNHGAQTLRLQYE